MNNDGSSQIELAVLLIRHTACFVYPRDN